MGSRTVKSGHIQHLTAIGFGSAEDKCRYLSIQAASGSSSGLLNARSIFSRCHDDQSGRKMQPNGPLWTCESHFSPILRPLACSQKMRSFQIDGDLS
eukprot:5847185-Pleurochrysis_carterae.AAC.1